MILVYDQNQTIFIQRVARCRDAKDGIYLMLLLNNYDNRIWLAKLQDVAVDGQRFEFVLNMPEDMPNGEYTYLLFGNNTIAQTGSCGEVSIMPSVLYEKIVDLSSTMATGDVAELEGYEPGGDCDRVAICRSSVGLLKYVASDHDGCCPPIFEDKYCRYGEK